MSGRDSALVSAANQANFSSKKYVIAFMKSGRVMHGLIHVPGLGSAIMIGNEFVTEDAVESIGCYLEADYTALLPTIQGKII